LAELGSDAEGSVLAGPRGAIDRLDLVMGTICAHLGIDDKVMPQTLSVECGCSCDIQARAPRAIWLTSSLDDRCAATENTRCRER
jgi:hypothetical protein